MRHTVIISSIAAVVASVLTTVAIGSLFGADTASSSNAPVDAALAAGPGGVESIIQGDVDCGTNVTPVDSLKVLRHDAGLSVQQDEPCPDIGTVIPTGEGVPGPQGPQGDEGPAGPQGPQGETGPVGVAAVEIVSERGPTNNSPFFKGIEVPCPAGKKVLGGGGETSIGSAALISSVPDLSGEAWRVTASEAVLTGSDWWVEAYAICANVAE